MLAPEGGEQPRGRDGVRLGVRDRLRVVDVVDDLVAARAVEQVQVAAGVLHVVDEVVAGLDVAAVALDAIKSSDENLGRVLAALDRHHARETTDIFIVSDHGFSTIRRMIELPKLSVIIPVYNEQNTLRAIIDRLHHVPLPMEIIAVNDKSSDGSDVILDDLEAKTRERLTRERGRLDEATTGYQRLIARRRRAQLLRERTADLRTDRVPAGSPAGASARRG